MGLPKVRRTQEERSASTQTKILAASQALMLEGGYVGLRIAEVASRAGVSRGAVLHHYPTKDDLILGTVEYVFKDSLERVVEEIDHTRAAHPDPLEAIIRYGKAFFFGAPFLLLTDIRISCTDNPVILARANELAIQLRDPAEHAMSELMVQAGMAPGLANQVRSLTLAIVRGLAARTPLGDDVDHYDELFDLWRQVFWTYHQVTFPDRAVPSLAKAPSPVTSSSEAVPLRKNRMKSR